MNDALYRWHILISEPGQELKAGDGLKARNFEQYVPKIARAQRAGRGAVRIVPKPMFNCYVFANLQIGAEPWETIRAIPGIRDFLQIEGRPASLPDPAFDLIRMTEADIEMERCRQFNRPPAFEIGQRVVIPKGPFSELIGRIKSMKGDRAEVLLEMAMMGRTVAKVTLANLQAA